MKRGWLGQGKPPRPPLEETLPGRPHFEVFGVRVERQSCPRPRSHTALRAWVGGGEKKRKTLLWGRGKRSGQVRVEESGRAFPGREKSV